MPEPTIPEIKKVPSISAQRLYYLLTQFDVYHDVYYQTKADELATSTRVTEGTASPDEVERYRKFEKNKLRANWFAAVQGFAYLLLNETSLDRESKRYKILSERIAGLKTLVDERRGMGILVSEIIQPEESTKNRIEDSDVEIAENLIKELLLKYVGTDNMNDVDALMHQYPVEQC